MNEISEEQYEVIRPYLPVRRGNVRVSNLTMINAVLYVTENGCKWRALPPRFGNWHMICTRMRRWAEAGVLDRLFEALQEHRLIRIRVECLGLDSTSIKVHPDATGAPKSEHVNAVGSREHANGLRPSANPGPDGTPRFIWLPRMHERP